MSDLYFDPDVLQDEMVVECRISLGPRSRDPRFDPGPSDEVILDDGTGDPPLRGEVVERNADRVLVRIAEPDARVIAWLRFGFLLAETKFGSLLAETKQGHLACGGQHRRRHRSCG